MGTRTLEAAGQDNDEAELQAEPPINSMPVTVLLECQKQSSCVFGKVHADPQKVWL